MTLQKVLLRLVKDSPESNAVAAGEIDAVVDRVDSNVILLPAARRALREPAGRVYAPSRDIADDVTSANSLLAALPRGEYAALLSGFEPLTLRAGQVLYRPGQPVDQVYFPLDCVICLLATAGDSQVLGIDLVGRDGMVGISPALGVECAFVRTLVQATGTAMRMSAQRFTGTLRDCPALQKALRRYAHEKLVLARRMIACTAFHAVDARLARWLLMTSDRVQSKEFVLTQALLANTLGVRRATINEAARPLRQRKLIAYSRGRIRILSREGLEAVACSCYAKIASGR